MRWRLQLAARALGSTSRSVADIAEEVGYESEAAFNRAFKREFVRRPPVIEGTKEQRKCRSNVFGILVLATLKSMLSRPANSPILAKALPQK